MKFLIWFGCIVVSILLNAFIGEITGIKAGALIMYIPLVFVPKKLCKLWDEYTWYKKHPEAKEEIRINFPSDFLNRCEEYRDKDSALRIF